MSNGYTQGTGGSSSAGHEGLKKDYLNYLENKSAEIKEQQDARRYYHGAQWTAKQIKAFNDRRQPVVTYNRISRKLNAIVGLNEEQRTDPKGFARTPKHEEGAEIATATLRYVLDEQEWQPKSSKVGLDAAIDGLAGVELIIEEGDKGDKEVGFEIVDPSSFFYDPRSLKADFSDARFMGQGKWADVEATCELFPDKEKEIRASVEEGSNLTSNPDSDNKWVSGTENARKIRIVDHWYIKSGKWNYCIYTGATTLAEGESYLIDEKGKTQCKYIMFSANVDHDGDRYGFVRGMKSAQDEINQRRSKGLHLGNSRRIVAEEGAFKDLEKARREAARPDGIIIVNPGFKAEFDDAARNAELSGQMLFLQDAKDEIENIGFNPALVGSGVQDMSGRAIKLQQQAGIAELGPYRVGFRGWKIRVYRAVWNAIQKHWTGERWIRVTDDDNIAQFFSINKLGIDPATGQPAIVNALGSLDVDIIIDEGPDTINMQADSYETLSIMASKGAQIPPQLLIEMSPLPGSKKKKYQEMLQQAQQQDPMLAQAKQISLAQEQAKTRETLSSADLKDAQTKKTLVEAQIAPVKEMHNVLETEHSRHERIAFKHADHIQQDKQQAQQPAL